MSPCRDLTVITFCQNSETGVLANVAGQRKYLRSREYRNFLAVMMPDIEPANARGDHAVGSDDHTIRAMECNDNGHPRKTLFTFISGYLL
jgi:hypothetical protein